MKGYRRFLPALSALLLACSFTIPAAAEVLRISKVITKVPAVLREAGDYSLASDLVMTSEGTAIKIIGSNIALDGAGHSIATIGESSTVLRIVSSKNVSVRNIALRRKGNEHDGMVHIQSSSDLLVSNSTFGQLRAYRMHSSRFDANTILGAMIIRYSEGNEISTNSISAPFAPIMLRTSNENLLKGNFIKSVGVGPAAVTLSSSYKNVLDRNVVDSNGDGLRVSNAGGSNLLTNNSVIASNNPLRITGPVQHQLHARNNIFLWRGRVRSSISRFRMVGDYNNFYAMSEVKDLSPRKRPRPSSACRLLKQRQLQSQDQNSLCVDPHFTSIQEGYFGLLGVSPMIDAGDPSFGTNFPGGRVDIGAIETYLAYVTQK